MGLIPFQSVASSSSTPSGFTDLTGLGGGLVLNVLAGAIKFSLLKIIKVLSYLINIVMAPIRPMGKAEHPPLLLNLSNTFRSVNTQTVWS